MGWWRISADTLAASRFVVSPLSETFACLSTLRHGVAAHPGEQSWVDRHLPAFRRRLADDPLTALVLRAAFGHRWVADFMTPPPTGADFAGEIRAVRDLPPDQARADLFVTQRGRLPATLVDRDDLAERAADLLTWVWTTAVRPEWGRRRRIIEADVVARTARLSLGGWSAVLSDMRSDLRWLGDGRLQVNSQEYPPKEIDRAALVFVPVTTGRGWVAWAEPDRYALAYPCAGVLADAGRAPVPAALGRLLGSGRAVVFGLLASPLSTTQLVALTGQGLGSVGRHLRVLLDAGLVARRRAGRSVLYYRTSAGDVLVDACLPGDGL
jgi:DNA-binding transcriptional ArsR family regulator